MKRLSAEQVLQLHEAVIERFWGDPGLRDPGLLASALARPFAEFQGTEAHPTVHDKAAALLHGLTINHPFVDGNKPVALAAMLVFLRVNGFRLRLGHTQRYEMMMRLAKGTLSMAELGELLRDAIEPLE